MLKSYWTRFGALLGSANFATSKIFFIGFFLSLVAGSLRDVFNDFQPYFFLLICSGFASYMTIGIMYSNKMTLRLLPAKHDNAYNLFFLQPYLTTILIIVGFMLIPWIFVLFCSCILLIVAPDVIPSLFSDYPGLDSLRTLSIPLLVLLPFANTSLSVLLTLLSKSRKQAFYSLLLSIGILTSLLLINGLYLHQDLLASAFLMVIIIRTYIKGKKYF